jgi:DNA-binding CsgD family transcriptional regulator
MTRCAFAVRTHNPGMRDPLSAYDTTALLRELTRRLERYWVDDPTRHEVSLTVERWRWHVRRRTTDAQPRLSPREQQIAGMVAAGDTNGVIAHRLGISTWTVAAHLRRIFEKLGVHTRAAMVARLRDHPSSSWPLEERDEPPGARSRAPAGDAPTHTLSGAGART